MTKTYVVTVITSYEVQAPNAKLAEKAAMNRGYAGGGLMGTVSVRDEKSVTMVDEMKQAGEFV